MYTHMDIYIFGIYILRRYIYIYIWTMTLAYPEFTYFVAGIE